MLHFYSTLLRLGKCQDFGRWWWSHWWEQSLWHVVKQQGLRKQWKKCWTNTGQKCFFSNEMWGHYNKEGRPNPTKQQVWNLALLFLPVPIHWFTCVDKELSMKLSKHTLMLQSHASEVAVSFFWFRSVLYSQSRFFGILSGSIFNHNRFLTSASWARISWDTPNMVI